MLNNYTERQYHLCAYFRNTCIKRPINVIIIFIIIIISLISRSTATSDLKDRLVRIESTSESKSQSGHSLGRAAQLILAASGKRSAPSSPSQTAPINKENPSTSSPLATTPTASSASSGSSTSVKRGKGKNKISVLEQPPDDAVILFEEQVKEFLTHIGQALKDATLTGT